MPGASNGKAVFFREYLRDFHAVGAVAPSGLRLCRALARHVSEGGGARRVLEVGPGTGAVTRQIVSRMTAAARLDLVEINSVFIKRLLYDIEHDAVLHPAAERISVLQIPVERLDRERRRLRQIDVLLDRMCAAHETRRDFIFSNIPPAWVHHLRFSH